MQAWLESVAPGYGSALLWTLAALIGLLILLIAIRIVRGLTFGTFVAGGRNRKTRLAVMDATAVDSNRRLVLVRRDDVEHLLLIGGPTDVVVEQNIRMVPPSRRPVPADDHAEHHTPAAAPAQPVQAPVSAPMAAPAAARPAPRVVAPVSPAAPAYQPTATPAGPTVPMPPVTPRPATVAPTVSSLTSRPAPSTAPAPAPAPTVTSPAAPSTIARVEPKFGSAASEPARSLPPVTPAAPATPTTAVPAVEPVKPVQTAPRPSLDENLLQELEESIGKEVNTSAAPASPAPAGSQTDADRALDDEMSRLLGTSVQ
ncbi:flagellar biosynthesis protein FliO [Aminobacter sp. J15]|nr:flagellar biosynthesis protein FliO [Aminobacter sp. J15]